MNDGMRTSSAVAPCLLLALVAGCSSAAPVADETNATQDETNASPDTITLGPDVEVEAISPQGMANAMDLRVLRPAFATPLFTATWQYAGTYVYTGGARSFASPITPRVATHVLLEAPLSCAPTLVSLAVSTTPFNAARPVVFVGQRWLGATVQALYAVGGTQVVNGVAATFTGWNVPQSCPVRFSTVYAL